MPDFATSTDPHVQRQLDRLNAMTPGRDILGLSRIEHLLSRLGDPHHALPHPIFHVAGTNGKGSVCAFLRAMLEADGRQVHVYTSPHLVRFNERVRIAGKLIDDAALAPLLEEVIDAADGTGASFFEVTTAAAFLAFSRESADATIVEVGLGGRLDATNILAAPDACAIAALGLDHELFLLAPEHGVPASPLARIAWEKAGIAKLGVPLVTMDYPPSMAAAVTAHADEIGAPLLVHDRDWQVAEEKGRLSYRDAAGTLDLPVPDLPGAHQIRNAGLAIAMLRAAGAMPGEDAVAKALRSACWPARLQKLGPGPLINLSPSREYWLDGGHNADAGAALARHFADKGPPLHIIIGMLSNKNADAILTPLAERVANVTVVPVPGHQWHDADVFRAANPALADRIAAADDVAQAIGTLPDDGLPVLICGSLYLAGTVLAANGQPPD